MPNAYRISEVAQKADVTPDTIRYYERLGVLPRQPRTAGGLRAYGDDVLPRVRFVSTGPGVGFDVEGREGARRE